MDLANLNSCNWSDGMIRALFRDRNPLRQIVCAARCLDFMQGPGRFAGIGRARCFGDNVPSDKHDAATGLGQITLKRERAMKLTIEIVAAALLVFCISAAS